MKKLEQFLAERKEEKRPLRKDEGKDDQLYIDLMGHYKHVARKQDRKEANKYLDKARSLKNVSDKAKTAGAYI